MTDRRSDTELKAIAKEAAHEAVAEVLTALGIDTTATAAKLEMQEDFAFLRGMRLGTSLARRRVFMLVLGGAVTGVGYLIWQGFISFIPGK